MAQKPMTKEQQTTIKVQYDKQTDFKGKVTAFVFDAAGNLLDQSDIKGDQASFNLSKAQLGRSRLYLAPIIKSIEDFRPTVSMMERLEAYEVKPRIKGKLIDHITIPNPIIELWLICLCLIRGRVVKGGSELPVCGAKVHICEVDKVWRWILQLPDLEIFQLRDDLLKEWQRPDIIKPPFPRPEPGPMVEIDHDINRPVTRSFKPQSQTARPSAKFSETPAPLKSSDLTLEKRTALNSTSAQVVRQALMENVHLITPYLCLWPYWWRLRCDEIAVVETDAAGRFESMVLYLCNKDKPDLYFWVEYEIDGVFETVYHPPMACHTHWNYACGSEVTLHIWDDRVPACDDEPDLGGCTVQILSIGRTVSISEIQGDGAAPNEEGLTTDGRPFGGKIEPRVWFSRTALRDGKNILYYRWSHRRLTEGDGTPLVTPGPWQPMTRTVIRHYAKPTAGGIIHEPTIMGPTSIGAETNLFEIKPTNLPAGGIEWTILDEREDLASGHFETQKLGAGADTCSKALSAAGKYELKLELFKGNGTLVDWTAEGIDLETTNVPAPFGTGTVTATTASDYNRIKNGAGHTVAFRMVLRVDNNCCQATVKPVTGTGLDTKPCGFIEFTPTATATLSYIAGHPNNFATFRFSVKHGVSDPVDEASAAGKTGALSVNTNEVSLPDHAYSLIAPSTYWETFAVTTLLEGCTRAAFSEALHVWAMATNGYGRLWRLDSFDHDAFALTPEP